MKLRTNVKANIVSLATIVMVFGFSSASLAAITAGTCDDCHTMHNSQAGAPLVATGALTQLLNKDCVGCHADGGTNAGNAFGGATPDRIPRVDDATNPLAGGYFGISTALADDHQHNVAGISTTGDSVFAGGLTDLVRVPGTASTFAGLTQLAKTDGLLECTDCHASGGHHENNDDSVPATAGVNAGSTADSFRFLYYDDAGTDRYVKGYEDDDYEYSGTGHNTYYATATTTDLNTISKFCADCHSDFHAQAGSIGSAGAWLRHPTDFALDTADEFTYNNDGAADHGNYTTDVPVGSDAVADLGTALATKTVFVVCLSCHRAHGYDANTTAGNDADMLRWDYDTSTAGQGATTGCLVCHTAKN